MRIVLDTNVLVRCLTTQPQTVAGGIYTAWESGKFELLVSSFIVIEVTKILDQPYFAAKLSEDLRAGAIASLQEKATLVRVNLKTLPAVTPHWQDGFVLLTADAGRADYLVTQDRELLNLQHFKTVKIIDLDECLHRVSLT
ncbi:MAG: putative toxin-antitoxin system toxin component, PIN family [Chloroflexota bacterium]